MQEYVNCIKSNLESFKLSHMKKSDVVCKVKGPADLVEIQIKSKKMGFRLEPHPMETWMALHGRHLRDCALQKAAWMSAIDLSTMDSVDTFLNSTTGGKKKNIKINSGKWILEDLFKYYYDKCQEIEENKKDPFYHHGGLMNVIAFDLDALVMVGDRNSARIIEATKQRIYELDAPSSDHVTFTNLQSIYIEANLKGINGHFGGIDEVTFNLNISLTSNYNVASSNY